MDISTEYPELPGVYKITCIINNKVYIGKSINLRRRLREYKYSAKNTSRHGRFTNAIKKYGWENFKIEILEIIEDFDVLVDNDRLLEIESSYIKESNSINPELGYNMCEYSTDFSGRKHTEESRMNMSKAKLGKKASEDTKLKMSKARIGRKLSDSTKRKLSESHRIKNLTDETKKRRKNCRLGKKHTEESLERMRKKKSMEYLSEEVFNERRDARRRENLSPETLEKMSRSQSGKIISEETKIKMRQAKLGKKLSEESKLKGRITRLRNKSLKDDLTMIDLN